MRTFLIVILLLYAVYYYGSRHFEFHETLAYAEQHKGAAWSGPVQYYVGMVYYQRSDYPKAQEAFTQMLQDHPTDYHAPRALVMLDDAAEWNHDFPAASDALQRYIEQFPNGKDIQLVRDRLDMLRYKHGNEIGAPAP